MNVTQIRQSFIDRTARCPHGKNAVRNYNDPKAHYKGFRLIIDKLNLSLGDEYFEIGCGGGVLLAMALKLVKFAAAIDHSPDMAKLAQINNENAITASMSEIVQGEAECLPWPDGRFTVGASANMFFFVEQPQAVLNEAYRVLAPGGRFAMVTMGKGMIGKFSFGWLYSLRTYSDQEMNLMFRKACFTEIEVRSQGLIPLQLCYGVKALYK